MAKSGKNKKGSGKRDLISPKGDKRYVKRDAKGRFAESDDQGKSLSRDVKKHADKSAHPGYGDQGDQKSLKKKKGGGHDGGPKKK